MSTKSTSAISRELLKYFSPTTSMPEADAFAPKFHYQVYTDSPGAAFNHSPAYIGLDRFMAETVAFQVGGTVHVCDGSP